MFSRAAGQTQSQDLQHTACGLGTHNGRAAAANPHMGQCQNTVCMLLALLRWLQHCEVRSGLEWLYHDVLVM